MKLVKVVWLDACTMTAGWKTLRKLRRQRPEKCVSIGYVVKKTKRYIILAASVAGKHCDGDVTIPLEWVTKIKRLK